MKLIEIDREREREGGGRGGEIKKIVFALSKRDTTSNIGKKREENEMVVTNEPNQFSIRSNPGR